MTHKYHESINKLDALKKEERDLMAEKNKIDAKYSRLRKEAKLEVCKKRQAITSEFNQQLDSLASKRSEEMVAMNQRLIAKNKEKKAAKHQMHKEKAIFEEEKRLASAQVA